MASVNSCNVLELGGEQRRLWRFSTSGDKVNLAGEVPATPPAALPEKWVRKDWHSLFQRTLNIAWLPADQVFVRVAQVPPCEPSELPALVEFQLERISPLPITQIVWTAQALPVTSALPEQMQTVIVLIASRSLVEQHLGELESQGYLPDRLELPFVHELLAVKETSDAVWIFPRKFGDKILCLASWYQAGVLKNVSLLHLNASDSWRTELHDQLTKIAWAGEMEGWLTENLRWNLVAEPDLSAAWEQALREWSNKTIQTSVPLARPKVAALSAQYAARTERGLNLLPEEYATRYGQQFIDRLWMRGAGLLVALYLVGVGIYLGALQYQKFQVNTVQTKIDDLETDYKKALELAELTDVLREQISLRYAALDCWKATAEKLPDDLTLTELSFSKGKTLILRGEARPNQSSKVTDFNEVMRKYKLNDKLLFAEVSAPRIDTKADQSSSWYFECELANTTGIE
ncbi:MAG: hypothetical protein AB1705_26920 [Verrucomicrobiota bacterium]